MAAPSFIGRSRFSMVRILDDTLDGSIPRISRRMAKISRHISWTSNRRRLSIERLLACRIVAFTRAAGIFSSRAISFAAQPRSRRLNIWPAMLMGLSTV